MTATKAYKVAELNAKLSVEVVDLDTELQHFLKLIREMRERMTAQLAKSTGRTRPAEEMKAVKALGEITKMLDRAVAMEIKLDKARNIRQKKLTPEQALEGAAKYILSQESATRSMWLKTVCKRHLEILTIENPSAVRHLVGQDIKSAAEFGGFPEYPAATEDKNGN